MRTTQNRLDNEMRTANPEDAWIAGMANLLAETPERGWEPEDRIGNWDEVSIPNGLSGEQSSTRVVEVKVTAEMVSEAHELAKRIN